MRQGAFHRFSNAMLERGVYLRRPHTSGVVSAAHSEADIGARLRRRLRVPSIS